LQNSIDLVVFRFFLKTDRNSFGIEGFEGPSRGAKDQKAAVPE